MSQRIEIEGTLHEDGSLVLDQRLDLPAGRVRVLVQPVLDPSQRSMSEFFAWSQAERARGRILPRSSEEIDAYLATMREDDREELTEMNPKNGCKDFPEVSSRIAFSGRGE